MLFDNAEDKSGTFEIEFIHSIVTKAVKKNFFPHARRESSPIENAQCSQSYLDFADPIFTFLEGAQQGIVIANNFSNHEDPKWREQLRQLAIISIGIEEENLRTGRAEREKRTEEDESQETERNDNRKSHPTICTHHTPTPTLDSSVLIKAIELLTQNQAGMQQMALESTKSLQATSKSKNLFENLVPQSQLIFKRASAKSHLQEVEPTAPFSKCVDLFNAAHRAKASFTLDSILKDSHKRGVFQVGNLTMILVRGPTWSSRVEPTGLTGLAFFPEDKKPDANPNAEIKAVLCANHDRSMINEDIDHYTNNKLFIPTMFDEIKI